MHIELAREYLYAADKVLDQSGTSNSRESGPSVIAFNAPAYYLLAHGTELTLKCVAQWDGMTADKARKNFKHNLEKLWDNALANSNRSRILINSAETHVRKHWKEKLRAERNDYLKRTDGYGDEFIDSDIENLASGISVSRSISWLNSFTANGGALRYYESSQMIQIPVINLPWGQYPYLPDTINAFSSFVLSSLEGELRKASREKG